MAVRAPIKLPRHASNILASRLDSEKTEAGEKTKRGEEEEEDGGDSDLECSLASDQARGIVCRIF